jgi:hypothetical protein
VGKQGVQCRWFTARAFLTLGSDVKNLCFVQGWKGRFSCYDTVNWTASLRAEVGYNPELAQKSDDGCFWICWEDVLGYFQVRFDRVPHGGMVVTDSIRLNLCLLLRIRTST